ncbi:OmpA family protein [Terricaulis sp.]|uniref:OmpA family protein n=1 Tax=Terricaulis sp. TaxID=2768686 RepID=UPI00378525A6
MRFLLAAAVLAAFFVTQHARAQENELDRAQSELSAAPSMAGVAVERRSRDELVVTMPSDITFDFNRAEVRGQFTPTLRTLARTLETNPSLHVQIVGHADAIGSDDYNQVLSERRAQSVGSRLMDFGIPYRRIEASGRGEWEPIASNATEYGRARNRRVEIRLTADKK